MTRYTTEKLREWKDDAEAAAQSALEERRAPATESTGVYLEAERLMPELIAELRTDVRGDTTELVRDVFIVGSRTWVVGFVGRQYFYYVTTEIPGLELQMDWLEEMGLLKDSRTGNVPHYRLSPDFAAWLRDGDVIDA